MHQMARRWARHPPSPLPPRQRSVRSMPGPPQGISWRREGWPGRQRPRGLPRQKWLQVGRTSMLLGGVDREGCLAQAQLCPGAAFCRPALGNWAPLPAPRLINSAPRTKRGGMPSSWEMGAARAMEALLNNTSTLTASQPGLVTPWIDPAPAGGSTLACAPCFAGHTRPCAQ